jgi:hypothetical protein
VDGNAAGTGAAGAGAAGAGAAGFAGVPEYRQKLIISSALRLYSLG